MIDDERRLQYQRQCYFKTTHYLTITWKPEQLIAPKLRYFAIEYRWSSRFICLDRMTTKAYLKRYERNWLSKSIGVMGVIRESRGLMQSAMKMHTSHGESIKIGTN